MVRVDNRGELSEVEGNQAVVLGCIVPLCVALRSKIYYPTPYRSGKRRILHFKKKSCVEAGKSAV